MRLSYVELQWEYSKYNYLFSFLYYCYKGTGEISDFEWIFYPLWKVTAHNSPEVQSDCQRGPQFSKETFNWIMFIAQWCHSGCRIYLEKEKKIFIYRTGERNCRLKIYFWKKCITRWYISVIRERLAWLKTRNFLQVTRPHQHWRKCWAKEINWFAMLIECRGTVSQS
jgi:hypothetical protein